MLYQQPQFGPLFIDWSNPISRKLAAAFDPVSGNVYSGTASKKSVSANTSARGVTQQGKTALTSGSAAYIALAGDSIFSANLWTSVSVVSFPSIVTPSAISTVAASPGSTVADRSLYIDASGHLLAFLYDNVSNQQAVDPAVLLANTPYVLAAESNGSTVKAWKNGVNVASTATANGGYTGYSPAPQFVIGYGSGNSLGGTLASNANIALQLWFSPNLTAAEHASIAANPRQLFLDPDEDDEALMFAAVGGGGTTGTLAATLGALTAVSGAAAPVSAASVKTLGDIALAAVATSQAPYYSTLTGSETPTFIGNDNQAAVLGQRFKALHSGYVFGARFYNPTAAVRTMYLYDQTGNSSAPIIAQANSTAATGWQDVLFSSPVAVDTIKEYTLAYLTPAPGQYTTFATKGQYDYQDIDSVNSYFDYSAAPVSPQNQYSSDGYGIAPLFSTSLATGPSPVFGTLTASLAAVTASGAGVAPVAGVESKTLATITLVASVAAENSGLLSAALQATAGAAVGGTGTACQANVSLGGIAAAVTAAAGISGQSARTLDGITSAAAGIAGMGGQVAAALVGLTASATGAVPASGSAAAALAPVALVSQAQTGAPTSSGALIATMGQITATSIAMAATSASSSSALAGVVIASTGTAKASGSTSATLSAVTAQTAATAQSVAASVDASLAYLTAASAGLVTTAAVASPALAPCTVVATIGLGRIAQAATTLGGLTLAANSGVLTVAGAQIALGGLQLVARASGEVFTPSALRTYRFPPENRRYRIAPENRKFKFRA